MKKLLALFAVLAMAGCACASVVPPPGRMPRPKPPVETALRQPGGSLRVAAAPVGQILLRGAVKLLHVGENLST